MPAPGSDPSTADMALMRSKQAQPPAALAGALWVGAISGFDDTGKTSIVWASENTVQITGGAKLPFPGGPGLAANRNAILGVDLNYDYKTDLVFAGAKGVRLFEQKDISNFTDVTAKTKIPANVANAAYTGAWAFYDVDLDGDLDIVLAGDSSEPVVLRNNGDGTFAVINPFNGVTGLKAFASADIDGDGDPDVALIDGTGKLHVFSNERLGQFHERALPSGWSGGFAAVIAADANDDGVIDFVLLKDDGSMLRLSDKNEGTAWDFADLAKGPAPHSPALMAADLDNNGRMDVVTGDGLIFMGGVKDFTPLSFKADMISPNVVDLNGDGKLDLIGLSATGSQPVALLNHGTKNYHWQDIRVRAATTKGDQRINSFSIGGAVEVRSGLLGAEARSSHRR